MKTIQYQGLWLTTQGGESVCETFHQVLSVKRTVASSYWWGLPDHNSLLSKLGLHALVYCKHTALEEYNKKIMVDVYLFNLA